VKISEDYETGIRIEDGLPSHLSLPKSNVIKYILTNDSWIVLRPSGTEPKLKIYVGVNDISLERAKMQNQMLSDAILKIVKQVG
ncbi:MAG: hypothetical protein WC874_00160, partial [Candidatus Izemoplasmatales bacterium]